ncbi:MAG: hypothetical protein U5K31_13545 [Balneolaceae bacterium]|nr:hypothetical protein [Balneolaceae bacterium]
MTEAFSDQWFVIYYLALGSLLLATGAGLLWRPDPLKNYLLEAASSDRRPQGLRRVLSWVFFFTLPGLVLSFFPFSWTELLLTLWSLFIVYICGVQLLRWPQFRHLLRSRKFRLHQDLRKGGALMVSAGLVIILLAYFKIHGHAFL